MPAVQNGKSGQTGLFTSYQRGGAYQLPERPICQSGHRARTGAPPSNPVVQGLPTTIKGNLSC